MQYKIILNNVINNDINNNISNDINSDINNHTNNDSAYFLLTKSLLETKLNKINKKM